MSKFFPLHKSDELQKNYFSNPILLSVMRIFCSHHFFNIIILGFPFCILHSSIYHLFA